ncbi:hypothetical protein PybrP1_004948 [[Pythium] brassicae (nom. inval.)]|nr:hypothetical protein PybrP1_004948 [[Pythium] brassicae (nom. inval.)]
MLREIGFWCQAGGDDASPERPDPTALVDVAWAEALLADPERLQTLQRYLTTGAFVESHELAYSYCRFTDCSVAQSEPKVMGACTLTDGVFCWPEGYWHYVRCHSVRPPAEFLQHVDTGRERMQRAAEAAQREGGGGEGARRLLLWDAVEQQAALMPRAMQEWITLHTTLQVAEPEASHSRD